MKTPFGDHGLYFYKRDGLEKKTCVKSKTPFGIEKNCSSLTYTPFWRLKRQSYIRLLWRETENEEALRRALVVANMTSVHATTSMKRHSFVSSYFIFYTIHVRIFLLSPPINQQECCWKQVMVLESMPLPPWRHSLVSFHFHLLYHPCIFLFAFLAYPSQSTSSYCWKQLIVVSSFLGDPWPFSEIIFSFFFVA